MDLIALHSLNIQAYEPEVKIIRYHDTDIEVKQSLSILDKIDLIQLICQDVINIRDNYYNSYELEGFFFLRVVLAYTNLTVEEEEGKNLGELYDTLSNSDFYKIIWLAIPETERNTIHEKVIETLENYFKYITSALGIMETLSIDSENLANYAAQIKEDVTNSPDLDLVKTVVEKLG